MTYRLILKPLSEAPELQSIGSAYQRFEFTPTNGQTAFVLPNWQQLIQADTQLYLNGVLQDDQIDYVWGDGQLDWIGQFALSTTDQITIFAAYGSN